MKLTVKEILLGSKLRSLFLLIILIMSKTVVSFIVGLGAVAFIVLLCFLINSDYEMAMEGTLMASTWITGFIALERVLFFFTVPFWIKVFLGLVYIWCLILYSVCFKN